MTEYDGIIFLGDPHLTTRKPARRLDEDWLGTLAGKLRHVVTCASDDNAPIVILGDLFDRAVEMDPRMFREIFLALRASRVPIYCLAGNHDMNETRLMPNTSLSLVGASGLIEVIAEPGVFFDGRVRGRRVQIGGSPYGTEIPSSVDREDGVEALVWITHQDLAFPGAYPGALEMFEISGCDMVVNGHMHLEQPSEKHGMTLWVNPGNMTRQSVDALDHVPGYLFWDPERGLNRRAVPHVPGKEIFNLEGRLVEAFQEGKSPENAPVAVADLPESAFVELLREEIEDAAATDDAGLLREEIEAMKEKGEIGEDIHLILDDLLSRAIGRDAPGM